MARRFVHSGCSCSRRDFLIKGMYGLGVSAALPVLLNRTSVALAAQALQGTSMEMSPERILVVVELSGGNDGLNTVVPFGDDEYYRVRPNLGIRESEDRGRVRFPSVTCGLRASLQRGPDGGRARLRV